MEKQNKKILLLLEKRGKYKITHEKIL